VWAPLPPLTALRHNPSVEHSIPTDRFQRGAVVANRFGTDRVKQVVAVDELPEGL